MNITEQIKLLFINIETVRLVQLKKSIMQLSIMLLAISVIFVSSTSFITDGSLKLSLAYLGVFVFAITAFSIRKPTLIYRDYYKDNLVPTILKSFGNFEYSESEKSLDLDIIENSKIVPEFGVLYSEDYINGMIDDVTFEFSELILKDAQGNSFNPKNVFKGGAIVLTMPFDFKESIIIKKEEGVQINLEAEKRTGKKTISFQDKVFEDCFEVYSDNEEYTRELLSQEMMNLLVKFKTLFKEHAEGISLGCEFKDNKILFLMEYKKDLMEPSNLFTPSYKIKSLHIIKEELKAITDIINQLKSEHIS